MGKSLNGDSVVFVDYSKPIARRTRGEEALFYKRIWEKKKKKEDKKKKKEEDKKKKKKKNNAIITVQSDDETNNAKSNVLVSSSSLDKSLISSNGNNEDDDCLEIIDDRVEIIDKRLSVVNDWYWERVEKDDWSWERVEEDVEKTDSHKPKRIDDHKPIVTNGLKSELLCRKFTFIQDEDTNNDFTSSSEDTDDFSDDDYSVAFDMENEEEFVNRDDENAKSKKLNVQVKHKSSHKVKNIQKDDECVTKRVTRGTSSNKNNNNNNLNYIEKKIERQAVGPNVGVHALPWYDDGGSCDKMELVKHNNKRKRTHKPSVKEALNTLANSIINEDDTVLNDEVAIVDVDLCDEKRCEENTEVETTEVNVLPLKFYTFQIESSTKPEKSKEEKLTDDLWLDMDFALRSKEIGSDDASKTVENKNVEYLVNELDRASLCRRGDHCLVLDEEIGVVCKYCYFLQYEAKYVMPPFDTNNRKKLEWRDDYGKPKGSTFDDMYSSDDLDRNFQSEYDPDTISRGTVWDLIPSVKDSMYRHQRDGFEFIWKNIAGGVDLVKLKNPESVTDNNMGGCIISHAPGTGKTRLTIVFLQTYIKLYPKCRPVIVAPRSMLLTWEEEFRKWGVHVPFHNLNKPELSGEESGSAMTYLSRAKEGLKDVKTIRMLKLYSWKKDGGVLGISYRLFEELAGDDNDNKKSKNTPKKKPGYNRKAKDGNIRKILLNQPDLFVFDEGHTPRNDDSYMWMALSHIKTKNRIMLSGTPFQNNFDELFNTLCLVRPNFGVKISSRHRDDSIRRGRKISKEKDSWVSLTGSVGNVSDDRLKEVRDLIAPFVHVHKGKILQESLPGLRHSVVVLRPGKVQKIIFDCISGTKNMISLDYNVSLVSVHPALLPERCLEKKEVLMTRNNLERLKLNPNEGVKTKFVFELLRLSDCLDEKVLIFAQYLEPLALLLDQLETHLNWTQGQEILYMDGKVDVKQRQSSINVFNDPESKVKVLLASTKACCEGINLIGASRVVLLDVTWNPSVERQAICRAYRLGQKKVVYIYHLITSGTMEEDKFCRQAEKHRLSESLFVPNDNNGGAQQKVGSTISEDKILEEMLQHRKLKNMFVKIYQQNESKLIDSFDLVGE